MISGLGAGAGAAQRYVLLTQAEYDALTEKEEDVLYLIKEELDDLFTVSLIAR